MLKLIYALVNGVKSRREELDYNDFLNIFKIDYHLIVRDVDETFLEEFNM